MQCRRGLVKCRRGLVQRKRRVAQRRRRLVQCRRGLVQRIRGVAQRRRRLVQCRRGLVQRIRGVAQYKREWRGVAREWRGGEIFPNLWKCSLCIIFTRKPGYLWEGRQTCHNTPVGWLHGSHLFSSFNLAGEKIYYIWENNAWSEAASRWQRIAAISWQHASCDEKIARSHRGYFLSASIFIENGNLNVIVYWSIFAWNIFPKRPTL